MRLPFVLAYLLRWCATLLLYALGWTPISRKDIKCHLLIKKGVIVYNHTTAWEFGLTLLYGWSCPELFGIAYFVVKPGLHKWLQYFSSAFVPATPLEERNQGFVAKTSALFLNRDRYHIYIAPDGQRKLGKWLPGYSKLASSLNNQEYHNTPVYIAVMGFDFVQHRLRFGARQIVDNSTDFKLLEQKLQKSCSDIVPLYPECCACCRSAEAAQGSTDSTGSVQVSQSCTSDLDVKVCQGEQSEHGQDSSQTRLAQQQTQCREAPPGQQAQQQAQHPTLLDYVWLTAVWTPMLPLYYAFQFDLWTAWTGVVCSVLSIVYHYSGETVLVDIEPILVKAGLFVLIGRVWSYSLLVPLIQDAYLCVLIVCTIGCYLLGCGRKCQTDRSYSYIYFHSLFHCLVSLCLIRIFSWSS